ncbi:MULTISPECIES: GNAT family N-acetyltransferase [unclassified Xanthomonas]|uniref:GNAT family N-acetyltransferase n=1 Tax=Xanthomonas sp. LMG 8992 TaxID=1591157 RepID=UPI001837F5DE|nr:GNAT family N-acetyltransferase [Xanthomonas sp. LMG 8992]
MSTLRFDCPAPLLVRGMQIRPECVADLPALRALYREQRWAEFAMLQWDDVARAAFIDQQFAVQQRHYTLSQEQVLFLVLLEDECVIGRMYLGDDAAGAVRLMDILLRPDRRGQGLGTALIAALLEQAAADGRDVLLQVEKDNPAAGLYRRLGFHAYADTDIAWQMVWSRSGSCFPA